MTLQRLKDDLRTQLFGETAPGHCVSCKDAFTAANVFTPAGERETHISGLCERCWNKLFAGEDE